jgi:hypothetical protein
MSTAAPVFVVGSPRSGTTLLHGMLMSAGGFAIHCSESHAYNGLGPRFGGFRTAEHRRRFLAEWLPTETFLRTGLEAEEVARGLEERVRSAGQLLDFLMGTIAERQGAESWADSTPDNGLFLRRIARDFPGARVIHVVRDPRDVASSLARQRWVRSLPGHGGRPLLAAAAYWTWIVRRIRRDAANFGERYLEVRFEELARTPERTLERVGGLLGRTLDLDRIRGAGVGAVENPNTSYGEGDRGFDPVLRWRRRMTVEEVAEVEALAGGLMAELGYECESEPAMRPALRLARRLYPLRFSLRTWLKLRTPLAVGRAYAPVLDWPPVPDESDPTLRPGEHLEEVRALVRGEAPPIRP